MRERLGKIHPRWIGGEYLPKSLGGEVEIARVRIASSRLYVISLRARLDGDEVVYRVVKDHQTQEHCERRLEEARSELPLTLGALLHLINASDIWNDPEMEGSPNGILGSLCHGFWSAGAALQDVLDRVRVSSEFYPELASCCDGDMARWFDELGPLEEDCDEE
jgi:hypothetical protein